MPSIPADLLRMRLRISAIPTWMLGASAMFCRSRSNRPGASTPAVSSAFCAEATQLETGVPETALSFRAEAEALKLQQVK
jgi:hypothetical protein